jgi:CVNH domain
VRHLRLTSKCGLIVGAALVLSFTAAPLHAQGAPPGSYLRTCTDVAVHGDRLIADCRRTDGSWGRTALRDVDRCLGDIGNMDGQLACNRSDRSHSWSQYRDYRQSPGYGSGYDRYDGPGYGSSGDYWPYRGGWPPAGYPSDYGR